MKKLTQFGLLLALVLGFTVESRAFLLIEPVIGYNVGKFNSELELLGEKEKSDDSMSGTSYGGRLGFQNLGFQLGLDYLASNLSVDGDSLKTSEFGGFVGFEFPILLRVYAGYVFSGEGTLEGDDDDIKLKSGTGPKLGVGFTVLPFLDLNLEYRSIKYEEKDLGALGKLNADYQAVMFGISLPFTI